MATCKDNVDQVSPLRCIAVTRHPSPISPLALGLTEEQKIGQIADHFRSIMELLGLDLSDPSLAKTPQRVAKMYVKELFSGLDLDAFPEMTFVDDPVESTSSEQVILLKIGTTSFCEHHFVPMVGHVFVGYIPNGRCLGLSKFSRVVRYFSRRPQLQERLTAQILDALSHLLQSEDIAVAMTATHFCVTARGIEDENSVVTSQLLQGAFESNPLLRQQFLLHAQGK